MNSQTDRKRVVGWYFFDWATQPFYTLGLTFIFGPYFAFVATNAFLASGMTETAADAQAQSVWSLGQMFAGLFIAFSAPLLGAIADSAGRKRPWIWGFSVVYVLTTFGLWWLMPDGTNLWLVLALFYIGFIAAETMLNFTNAMLPSLGSDEEIGKISGTGASLGYWGGVLSLFIMLLLLAENDTGVTLIGIEPILGLDPEAREGTRSVGPFIAIWFMIFMIPFFVWVKEGKPVANKAPIGVGRAFSQVVTTIKGLTRQRSMGMFLLSSMFYRDALNAIYAFGGVYATLVLNWSIIQIGVFGIVGAITAAIATYIGGMFDRKFGPMPVIKFCIWALIIVSALIVGMSRDSLFGVPLGDGSSLPDIIFYICGATIGGAGGALYAASRSMMVRHIDPAHPTEAFGLFALAGKATAFLAPALIALFTWWLKSNQLGFLPVIGLFIFGLFLLRWVNPNGERAAEWDSKRSSPSASG
ncbi:MAG: MFS transporter [Rhodobacteraceae bacterium]|nr:MFS transporter [Paracoccaceae bacterium]